MEKSEEAGLEKAPTEKSRKAKEPKQPVEPKSVTFPVGGTINAYGFIHLNAELVKAFGVTKGKKTPISIDFKDGALVIRKA